VQLEYLKGAMAKLGPLVPLHNSSLPGNLLH
jgi:hypothetical protein